MGQPHFKAYGLACRRTWNTAVMGKRATKERDAADFRQPAASCPAFIFHCRCCASPLHPEKAKNIETRLPMCPIRRGDYPPPWIVVDPFRHERVQSSSLQRRLCLLCINELAIPLAVAAHSRECNPPFQPHEVQCELARVGMRRE